MGNYVKTMVKNRIKALEEDREMKTELLSEARISVEDREREISGLDAIIGELRDFLQDGE